jgi:hypothetical protein
MKSLFQRIDEVAAKHNLSPCAMPGRHHDSNVAWIETDDWSVEARADLARIAAKKFTPEGYYYVAAESINS